jgi:Flp pilus assembly protein TadG
MQLRNLLSRLTDRRRSARILPDGLVAYYWTGGAPKPMEVRDVGLYGAYIQAPNGFYPATLINLMLENQAIAGSSLSICAQVGRQTQDGFCVSFLPRDSRERAMLTRFLANVRRKSSGELREAVSVAPSEEPAILEPPCPVDLIRVGEDASAAGALPEGGARVPPELFEELVDATEMEKRRRTSRRRRLDRGPRRPADGQALIELALLLPLLFLLIVNVINFGGLLYAWITVSNSARVGAQYYITGPATVGAPARPTESAVQSLVINDLKALPNALASQVCVSTSLSSTVSCNTGSAPSTAPPPAESAEGTPPITFAVAAVDVTYTYQPFIRLWEFTALRIHATVPPTSIHRQAIMRILQ